jgi:hypothetical protein
MKNTISVVGLVLIASTGQAFGSISLHQEGAAAKATYQAFNVKETLDKNSSPQLYYKIGKNIVCVREGTEKYFCSKAFDANGVSAQSN